MQCEPIISDAKNVTDPCLPSLRGGERHVKGRGEEGQPQTWTLYSIRNRVSVVEFKYDLLFISLPGALLLYAAHRQPAAQCSSTIHTDPFGHRPDFWECAPSTPCPMLNKQELSSAGR